MGPKDIWVTTLTFLGHVIGHVTNRSAICHFLLVSHWNRTSISNRFRDICSQRYLGHDLDFSRSRDVIGHVTNRSAICHCYWCTIGTEPLSLTVFEIFGPQYPCARARTHQHAENRKTPQVILYSVPCNVLHWTDKNITVTILLSPRCNCAAIIQTNKRVSFRFS